MAVQVAMSTTSSITATGTGSSPSKANSDSVLAALSVLSETSLNLLRRNYADADSASGSGEFDPCSTGAVTLGNETLLSPRNSNCYRSSKTTSLNTDMSTPPATTTDNLLSAALLTALRKVQSFIANIPHAWMDDHADPAAGAGVGYDRELMDALAMHVSSSSLAGSNSRDKDRDLASAVYWLLLRLGMYINYLLPVCVHTPGYVP